ncbi:hypothetical protein DPMN_072444 [Dreissena polymorpha]|uniref:Uncharacterized protein n=1 Tax=Dreissena polymorpha TaxID=45954 RepID=A0A9D3Z8J6_DREPO|nr:hypothetical protein DPMN_072444 [Dreissena polymorpha]
MGQSVYLSSKVIKLPLCLYSQGGIFAHSLAIVSDTAHILMYLSIFSRGYTCAQSGHRVRRGTSSHGPRQFPHQSAGCLPLITTRYQEAQLWLVQSWYV